jgi:DNA invertase Pin-like site-specific DNA recombinase
LDVQFLVCRLLDFDSRSAGHASLAALLLQSGKSQASTPGSRLIVWLDRGTRNLREWADIGDLIDADVRIASESVDLRTRGGRLSADIRAVIVPDYIRVLRKEVRRGFYDRVKQGFFPLRPLGGYWAEPVPRSLTRASLVGISPTT